MDYRHIITIEAGKRSGKPCIRDLRITVSDGESRTLPAGTVVLVEDVSGRGHVTEHEPGERRVLLLPLVATAE